MALFVFSGIIFQCGPFLTLVYLDLRWCNTR
jgi:hypothetical protein